MRSASKAPGQAASYARLTSGRKSLTHRKTLVTRNQADFEDTGVSIVKPWAG
jgi:hypothetical protein